MESHQELWDRISSEVLQFRRLKEQGLESEPASFWQRRLAKTVEDWSRVAPGDSAEKRARLRELLEHEQKRPQPSQKNEIDQELLAEKISGHLAKAVGQQFRSELQDMVRDAVSSKLRHQHRSSPIQTHPSSPYCRINDQGVALDGESKAKKKVPIDDIRSMIDNVLASQNGL